MGKRYRAIVAAAIAVVLAASAGPVFADRPAAKEAGEQVKRGYKAAKRGYWQEALFRFERANELTPKEPRILNNIAIALEASGRFEEAMVVYQTALAVAPNDRIVRENYSRFQEFYEAEVAEPRPDPAGEAQAESGEADAVAEEESDDA